MSEVVQLAEGDLMVTVAGGDVLVLTSLRHRGVELLAVPDELPPDHRVHGRYAGIALLHPWANRVGADRFAVGGAEVDLGAEADGVVSRDPGGLAIHGLAREGAWAVEAEGSSGCAARGEFPATPGFPFPHAVEVRVVLEADRVVITTVLQATGDEAVPVAFGWHPYFVLSGARATWELELPARTHLVADDAGLPTGATAPHGDERAPLAGRSFDDGYAVGPAGAETAIAGGGREVRVVQDEGFPVLQLFAPPDTDVVSLEPMTAPTDALRTGDGLRFVAHGEAVVATFAVIVR